MKNNKNRFLIPAYLINTINIKWAAFWQRVVRGSYPYSYFVANIRDTWDGDYNIEYRAEYHSLSYFDYDEAKEYHDSNSSVTIDLIKALTYHDSRSSLESKVDLLGMAKEIAAQGEETDDVFSFPIHESYERFSLEGTYYSAIVQGKAASLFVRCYKKTEDKEWLRLAKKSLNHFDLLVQDGGIKRQLPNEMIWMEEYPSPKPSMVLNGFLFWLIGLGEYCVVDTDPEYALHFEKHLRTAISWLPAYRLKNGLLYSMYRWNHCNVHYTAIMKFQFEHLYRLTNVELFTEYAAHCDKLTNWDVFYRLLGIDSAEKV